MSTLTRRLAVICSLTLTQACGLSILTPADSLPTYSHTIRLTAIHSHSQACCLSILSLSLRLAAYLCSHHLACCLSILTPADSLPTYSHTIRLTAIYSHSIRLAAYLFSHYQAHSLSILTLKLLSICFTPNAVKAFLLSSSPMYSSICSHTLLAYYMYLVPHPDIKFQLSGSPPISHSCAALPQPDSLSSLA